jgi:UDP-N-acetylglucosamine acyltransferase
MSIHPTAVVSKGAQLGADVTVGPFAIIEENVVISDRCIIEASAQIRKGSNLGVNCFVGSGAIIGSDPQFRDFDPRIPSGVEIASGNIFREYVTVHRSVFENGVTCVGRDNYLMVGSHIGHDSTVGHSNTLANDVLLGGHVDFGNHCFVGGGSAFHQFVRVGDFVMCQGHSGFSQDLPPFVIGADINTVVGINVVGLKRANFSVDERKAIKEAFREIYHSSKPLEQVLDEASAREITPAVEDFFAFFRKKSKKGLCIRSSRRPGNS